MKRLTLLLLAGALVALILQPVSVRFNTQFDNNSPRADGMLPPPPWPTAGVLLADGMLPPPPWPGGGMAV